MAAAVHLKEQENILNWGGRDGGLECNYYLNWEYTLVIEFQDIDYEGLS